MISAAVLRQLAALQLPPEAMAEVLSIVAEVSVRQRSKGAVRQARYRERHSAVSSTESVTSDVTKASQVAPKESIQTPSASLRSAAPAMPDARTTLFRDGLGELAALTGRTPSKLRPLLGRWLRDADDDALRILTLIAKAGQDRPAEPIPWIERHLRPSNGATNGHYGYPISDMRQGF
jgi:hypothetical protein